MPLVTLQDFLVLSLLFLSFGRQQLTARAKECWEMLGTIIDEEPLYANSGRRGQTINRGTRLKPAQGNSTDESDWRILAFLTEMTC
ncbi:MAG: hypothetical protein EBU88_20430 [Acidobacteria bacterium]|nr:hypothetical protein [Acidobacteriota bacterium]